jgi:hypothetical protein
MNMANNMATSTSDASQVNKTALIQEALTQNPKASPKEVAANVGHGVTAKYVSRIKSNLKSAGKKTRRKKPGRPKGSKRVAPRAAGAPGNLDTAILFVEAAGGIEAAKQQIETLERIKRL